MNGYKKITAEELGGNTFKMIGSDWMLVTATDKEGRYNTMTASWGGFGILWNKPVAFVFIRPQRYTHEFSESGTRATLSFFGGDCRRELAYCGKVSGRGTDKIKDIGLTPVTTDEGATGFGEATVVVSCLKLYSDVLKKEGFCDPALADRNYTDDFHTAYVYEIESVYVKD